MAKANADYDSVQASPVGLWKIRRIAREFANMDTVPDAAECASLATQVLSEYQEHKSKPSA